MEEEHVAAAPGQVCWIFAGKIYGDVNAPEAVNTENTLNTEEMHNF